MELGGYVWLFAIIKTELTSNSLTKPKLHDRFKEVINVDFQGFLVISVMGTSTRHIRCSQFKRMLCSCWYTMMMLNSAIH